LSRGASRNFCRPCQVIPFFVRPAPRAPSSRPHVSSTVARSGSQGRRFFRAAEGGLSLTDASAAVGCQRSGVGRAMIRGEPAIGRDQSREPRLYSVEPVRGAQTMKQSYASAGKAPRRRVHSLSGVVAIAGCGVPPPRIVISYPAHQAQSGAEPCYPFSFSRVLLMRPAAARRRPAPRRS
jgi:hypothetical protein